jgi:tRNA nucleotidyltransferase/poly(A) polymerase
MKTDIKQILREGLVMEQRIRMDIPIPSDIQQIQQVFNKNGYKLYVVGGAVRDALLGKTPKDYDLATDAVPDKVEEIIAKAGFKTLPTGKAFGVINVFTDQGEYEIATFRNDTYVDEEPDLESFKTYLKSLNNGSFEDFMDKLMK